MNDFQDNDLATWLDNIGKTPKESLDSIPRESLDSFAKEQHFLKLWFNTWRPREKLELAYRFGLVELDDNQRFLVKNSFVRDYKTDKMKLLQAIYWRDEAYCGYCDNTIVYGNGQIDHVIPRSAWPQDWVWLADDSSNLVAACQKCNLSKSNFYKTCHTRLIPIMFECSPRRLKDEDCCKSVRWDLGMNPCMDCPEVFVCCRAHEELWLPICWLESLGKWFGHA